MYMKGCFFVFYRTCMQEMRDARHWYVFLGSKPSLSFENVTKEYNIFGVLERRSVGSLVPPPEKSSCGRNPSHPRLCLPLYEHEIPRTPELWNQTPSLVFRVGVTFSELKIYWFQVGSVAVELKIREPTALGLFTAQPSSHDFGSYLGQVGIIRRWCATE